MRWAKKLFLTGEVFCADRAEKIGLLHHIVSKESLDQKIEIEISSLLQGGLQAQVACKRLFLDQAPLCSEQRNDLAKRIALVRAGAEAQEGVAAFLEKRSPSWRK
jgi:methylglutaconyl-CoA hydratase